MSISVRLSSSLFPAGEMRLFDRGRPIPTIQFLFSTGGAIGACERSGDTPTHCQRQSVLSITRCDFLLVTFAHQRRCKHGLGLSPSMRRRPLRRKIFPLPPAAPIPRACSPCSRQNSPTRTGRSAALACCGLTALQLCRLFPVTNDRHRNDAIHKLRREK